MITCKGDDYMILEKIIPDLLFILVGLVLLIWSIVWKIQNDRDVTDKESRKILRSAEKTIKAFGIVAIVIGIILLIFRI